MKVRNLILLLALLAGPAALAAQAPPAAEAPARHRPGPVEILLRNREEIGLSDEQVARLEEIRRALEERNRPLVARLVEIRREARREGGRHLRDRVEDARPLMARIRANNHAAMRRVGEVLTPEQKARVRELLEARRGRRRHHV